LRFGLSLSIVSLIAVLTAVSAFAAPPKVTYAGKKVTAVFTGVAVPAKVKCTYASISNPKGIVDGSDLVTGFKKVGNTVSFKATFKLDATHPAHGTYKAIIICFTKTAMANVQVPFVVNAA
jgi:hypothetical protein